ncbi:MAG: AmmeMemoRadiSam system protein B [Treponema sp.]|nr:AmmeMemoRadiSam system protein B [Treponema sp.]
MNLRGSCLAAGWYYRNPAEISRFLSEYSGAPGAAKAAIAPHAGWFYSGKIAARAAASLDRSADTVVIIGGHLAGGAMPVFALEDAVDSPLGYMEIDAELRDALYEKINGEEDRFPDNTVEVLVPMARFFFPKARLLWVRFPADRSSFEHGKALAAAAKDLGRNVAVLGSTDLTHYGQNFGFTPKGGGLNALRWMREVNDRNFIDAVESGDPAAVLEKAKADHSSCSAGAVTGAMGFAAAERAGSARLLEYGTSADAENSEEPPASFVGYASFVFG